jgi:endonuclease/exonuclease/phosphatase family metal-dependent hydrolase
MVIDDTSMCFINVHLAAGQSHRAARTADLAAIMEDKAIFPPADKQPYVNGGNGTGILDHEMVVLNGDLNYRIDQRREVVISSIQSGDLDFLLPHDQLHKEMRGNHAFRLRSFAEPPITFAPTYKYDPGTNNYDSSDKRRIPAWCDRVLYLKNERVHPLNYQRYEITCSDHKPVSAGLAMQVKRINADLMRATYKEILQDWVRREADMLPKIAAAYAALY